MRKQQNRDGGKIHNGREGSIRLVISGGDSAKPLDFLEKNTLPDGVLYIDASQPARDRKRCCAAGSHSWPRALRYCSFVNSYRFMLITSHNLVSCATFIFQTRPNYKGDILAILAADTHISWRYNVQKLDRV